MEFKLLFQELCESKADWDYILAGDLRGKLDKLVSRLQGVQPFELERWYSRNREVK